METTTTSPEVRALYLKSVDLERTPTDEITETEADLDNLIEEGWRLDALGGNFDGSYPTLRRLFRVKRALALRERRTP